MTNEHEPWPDEPSSPFTFEGQRAVGDQMNRRALRQRGWRLVVLRAFALLALAALVVPFVVSAVSALN
jgi:hypothetical protein